MNNGFAVAVDGPAGAGKSSTTDTVAKRLGIKKINSGSMYRAVALYVLRKGVDIHDEEAVLAQLPNIEIELTDEDVFLNGENVITEIRNPVVDAVVPITSEYLPLRKKMVAKQREYAKTTEVLMEGRDIGYEVFPDAPVRIYLHASAKERANRRYKQNIANGMAADYEQILNKINERDMQDQSRKHGRLLTLEDALAKGYIEVDSSNMSEEETVNAIIAHINAARRKQCFIDSQEG
ncbi:MAG: (d)CMP kinase [Defluviitaleaceae bacterium]|nr:(d)CMP kinase [Defluviitaleaceae bacterium]